MKPICENVKVKLTGKDGNSMFIISRVAEAMKRAKVEKETIYEFIKEAMDGDYDNVLRTCLKYVEVS